MLIASFFLMFWKVFIFLVFACFYGISQTPKVSFNEFKWALAHPVAALKVKKITKKCYAEIDQKKVNLQLDNFNSGGKSDAYRHIFFMSAYAQKIKVRKLRRLGKAHEKANYKQFLKSKMENGELADSLGCIMDLQNNELGFKIGASNKKLKLEELSQFVISEIKKGKAMIMKRDEHGNYLDCDGKKIDLNFYKRKWNVPKCLVASD